LQFNFDYNYTLISAHNAHTQLQSGFLVNVSGFTTLYNIQTAL